MPKSRPIVTINLKSTKEIKRSIERIEKFETLLNQAEDVTKSIAKDINKKHVKPMLRELRKYPKPRNYPADYPLTFKTPKQAFFVKKLLKGKPYQQTGDLAKGWFARAYSSKNLIRIRLKNKEDYHIFVVGKWGMGKSRRSIKRYLKPIQPFHAERYTPAYITIQRYMIPAREEAEQRIKDWFEMITSVIK